MTTRGKTTLALTLLAMALWSLPFLAQSRPEEMANPQGPYVGQTPPGTTPVVFAPRYISKPGKLEYGCTFTPDGNEFYFSRDGNTWFTILGANGWSKPKKAAWNTPSVDMEPHVTADGSKLMFSSNRPGGSGPSGIWVLDRAGAGWGQPRFHGPGMYPTTARNGNLYVTDIHISGREQIGVQRFENGQYGPLEMLDEGVNDGTPAIHPCISWDESFLIFDGPRPDALGGAEDSDFYISFRNPDGSWTRAAHFLEISSERGDMTASISPDGKYIFFFQAGDLWWVSSEIVERYRPGRAEDTRSPRVRGSLESHSPGRSPAAAVPGESGETKDAVESQYLGQEPPGTTPKLFPPLELQSDASWFWHGSPMFSPDLTEMYYVGYVKAQPSDYLEMRFVKYENGQWTSPQRPSFTGAARGENNPFFGQSNDILYYRPPGEEGFLLKVERAAGEWSQPVQIPVSVPGGYALGLQFSMARNGALYGELWDSADGNMKCWPLNGGRYKKAKKLKGSVNSTSYDFMPFVDPEERFLLFCSNRPGGIGGMDLYITFRGAGGKWSEPRNLGAVVNTDGDETWPSLSPDGKYLFFCRGGENGFDPYWVDATVVEGIGPSQP